MEVIDSTIKNTKIGVTPQYEYLHLTNFGTDEMPRFARKHKINLAKIVQISK